MPIILSNYKQLKDISNSNVILNALDDGYNYYLSALAGEDILNGANKADVLYGGAGNDTLRGNAGNDCLYGEADNDILYGGIGNDTLEGGFGIDILYGEAGNDRLIGDDGNDTVHGGTDADTILGDNGEDILYGDEGNDRIYGGNDNDILYGGLGNDYLYGDAGSDTYIFEDNFGRDYIIDVTKITSKTSYYENILDFSAMTQAITANLNATTNAITSGTNSINLNTSSKFGKITGSQANDTITGNNTQSTTFQGGLGDDVFNGGDGNDTYVYALNDGNDIITDTGGIDNLDLSALIGNVSGIIRIVNDYEIESSLWTKDGNNLILNFGSSNVITINNFYTTGRIENIILNTSINQSPIFSGDRIAEVNEGSFYILTSSDLNTTDIDNTNDELVYTISGITNGNIFVNGILSNTFTQADINNELVRFVHDGSETTAASFNFTVSDGTNTLVSQAFDIIVNSLNNITNQLSGDFLVPTTNTNNQYLAELTTLSNGGFVVTWQTNDVGFINIFDIRGRVFNADGSPVNASDFAVSTSNINNQVHPEITTLSNGGFAISWYSSDNGLYDIRGRVFNADGSPVNASDILVSTNNTNSQAYSQIVSLSNGGFVIVWQSDDNSSSNYDIKGRVFNADGSPVNASDILISTSNTDVQQAPQITSLENGGFVITWNSMDNGSNYDIRGRVFNADGSPVNASDFAVSTSNTNNQYVPQITSLENGDFVICWYSNDNGSNYDIRARVFNPDGSPVNASDILISTTNTSNQGYSEITSLENGGFVIVWRSYDSTSNWDIRGRVFNADGTPVNTEDFAISTSNTNIQQLPQITKLLNGGFVVIWESNDNGSDYDIRARVFNADGTAVNASDILVSTSNIAAQEYPEITVLENDNFVVAWESSNNGSDYDIRARIFDANGNPLDDLIGIGTINNDLLMSQSTLKDILIGDAGNDLYIFKNIFGTDIVRDTSGIDSIDLSDFTLASATFIRQEGAITGGDDLFIDLGANGSILIEKYFTEDSGSVAGTGLIETISFQDDSSVDLAQIAAMGL